MRRLHFALDLRDDPSLIAKYEAWHAPQRIWPEVAEFLRGSGVRELEIFRCGDRLVMAMEVKDDFSMGEHMARAKANARMQAWEELMWTFQRRLPFAGMGEKWVPMTPLFRLTETLRAQGRDQ